jgi:hypothetical protein
MLCMYTPGHNTDLTLARYSYSHLPAHRNHPHVTVITSTIFASPRSQIWRPHLGDLHFWCWPALVGTWPSLQVKVTDATVQSLRQIHWPCWGTRSTVVVVDGHLSSRLHLQYRAAIKIADRGLVAIDDLQPLGLLPDPPVSMSSRRDHGAPEDLKS